MERCLKVPAERRDWARTPRHYAKSLDCHKCFDRKRRGRAYQAIWRIVASATIDSVNCSKLQGSSMIKLRIALREYVDFENAMAAVIAKYMAAKPDISIEAVPLDRSEERRVGKE